MTEIAHRLTVAEADVLADCEQRIERGLATFVEVGTALATIRGNRLYRAEFGTFEDYCQQRWGISRPRAYELMSAAEVVSAMADTELPAPNNERQARELARVPEPERTDVWRETVERTEGKPTAAAIRETYAERTEPDEPGDVESLTTRTDADHRPPVWDPEERRQHEAEVRRRQDIESARRTAQTIVTEVRSLVVTVVTGSRYGEKGLVTADLIRELREAINLLEGEL